MNRKLATGLYLGTLMIGVAALAGGLAMLLTTAANSIMETGVGIALVLAGLGSWMVGVWFMKHAHLSNHEPRLSKIGRRRGSPRNP